MNKNWIYFGLNFKIINMNSIDPSLPAGNPHNPEQSKELGFDVGFMSIEKNHPNEDTVVVEQKLGLFAVLDGAGGHVGGEIASSTGAAALKEIFSQNPSESLWMALQQASDRISERTEGATTAAVAKVIEKDDLAREVVVQVATVGDARVYILDKEGKIRFVTIDNMPSTGKEKERENAREQQTALSRIESDADVDGLSAEQRLAWKRRNVVSEYLGGNKYQNPLVYQLPIGQGETILITSDGIHDNLTDDEICNLASSADKSQAVADKLSAEASERSKLGREVHERSKRDDISVVVLKYGEIGNQGRNLKDFLLDPTEISNEKQQPQQNETEDFYAGKLPKNETVAFDTARIPFPIRVDLGGFELELTLDKQEGQPDKLVVAVPNLAAEDYRSGKYMIKLDPAPLTQTTMFGREQTSERQLGIHLPRLTSREHLQLGFDGKTITFRDLSLNGTNVRQG